MAAATGTPTRAKKNAASQFRRRKRIAHPLLDSQADTSATPGYSTPPRSNSQTTPAAAAVTPEPSSSPETPALVSALQMAARPNNSEGNKDATKATEPAAPSYTSSIEAMAAHVERSHSEKKRSPRKSKLRSRRSGGSTSSNSRSPLGSRKSLSANKAPQAGRKVVHSSASKKKGLWLIAIPILASFLVCETFLWLLVFRFRESLVTGEVVLMSPPDVHKSNAGVRNEASSSVFQQEIAEEEKETEGSIVEQINVTEEAINESESSPTHNGVSHEEEPAQENAVEVVDEELLKLQSMLEEGFSALRGSASSQAVGGFTQESVESLCGNVWVAANEIVSSKTDDTNNTSGGAEARGDMVVEAVVSGELTPETSSQSMSDPWKSLALDAQHCLGGAGLTFLTKDDIDSARLRISTKVFDRLVSSPPIAILLHMLLVTNAPLSPMSSLIMQTLELAWVHHS